MVIVGKMCFYFLMKDKFNSLISLIAFLLLFEILICRQWVEARNSPPIIEDAEVRGFRFAQSASYLTHLAMREIQIYNKVKELAQGPSGSPESVNLYLTSYEESAMRVMDDIKIKTNITEKSKRMNWMRSILVAANPINSYRMIRRLVKELPALEKYLKSDEKAKAIVQIILKLIKQRIFPNEDNLVEAIEGLVIIQDFYDLKSSETARGKTIAKETGIKLSARHCLEIAKTALDREYYSQAIEWLQTGEEISSGSGAVSSEEFRAMFNLIATKHDENFGVNWQRSHPHMYKTKLSSLSDLHSLLTTTTVKEIVTKKYLGNLTNDKGQQTDMNFMAICRGEEFISEEKRSRLFCYLDRRKHPWFTLMPLKKEILSNSPYAVVVYEAVPNSWIQKMIKTAWPVVRRVPNSDATRTPTYAWFTPVNFPTIPIERRLEMIFDFKTVVDDLQINSYASGAYVMPHLDFYDNEYGVPGALGPDRLMATALIYLTDVEEGGQTAFTSLGIAAKPIKGSVLFWYATLRNGEIDKRTMHASCPVAHGHKWITTKWIHNNENFQTRPCFLNRNI